jgi:cytochrome c
MDSFELNKIAGAVLATLLVALGLNIFSGIIFAPRPAGDAGYPLPVPQEDAAPQGAAAPAPRRSLSPCSRQRRRGEGPVGGAQVRVCHSFEKGGPNRVGPNLHDVVGRAKAAVPNFSYSAGSRKRAASGASRTSTLPAEP